MERLALLFVVAFLGYVSVGPLLWDFLPPDDQMVWAALLPSVYLLGMVLLTE